MMTCSCGGVLDSNHAIGIGGCLREKVSVKPRKVVGTHDRWFIDGRTITWFTLVEQRGYYLHDCGNWSRPKDHESTNSLPGET